MGNCHCSEVDSVEVSGNVDKLATENLLLLKAMWLHFVDSKQLGLVIKIRKIHYRTEEYYHSLQHDRHETVARSDRLTLRQLAEFQQVMKQEHQQLTAANQFLKKKFKELTGTFFAPSSAELETYVAELKRKSSNFCIVRKVERAMEAIVLGKKLTDQLAMEMNGGQPLDPEAQAFVKELCSYTTYMITQKDQRVEYPPVPEPYRRRSVTRRSHKERRSPRSITNTTGSRTASIITKRSHTTRQY